MKVLRWSAVGFVVALALLYVGDDLSVRYRLTRPQPDSPLETVTVYYGTRLKGNKVEIFYDNPSSETCVHAMLPHLGYRPCWYVGRIKVVML